MNITHIQNISINPNFLYLFHYDYVRVILAYCMLPLAVVVLILNSFLLWIFWKKKATNTMHLFIAALSLSETLFSFVPSVMATYLFAVKGLRMYLPYKYCTAYYVIITLWTSVFRLNSRWLTVMLATQRCICVMFPLKTATIFTTKRTIYVIVGVFVLSILSHYYDIIFMDRVNIIMPWSVGSAPRETCAFVAPSWTEGYAETIFLTNEIFKIVFMNSIPSLWLVIVGCLLIHGLRKANTWRKKFVVSNERKNRRLKNERKLTVLTIWIIVTFVVFQIPYSVSDSISSHHMTFGDVKNRDNYTSAALIITHFIVLLSLPSTFLIYIICLREYCDYVKTLFCPRKTNRFEQYQH